MTNLMKLYYDLLSQPCRALYMFFEVNKIPYRPVLVSLQKGDNLNENFKKIHPRQDIPYLEDNGVKISEGVPIFRYVAREKLIPDHWYPKKSKQIGKIDEYLEWQQKNLNIGSQMYFKTGFMMSKLSGDPINENTITQYREFLKKNLDVFEKSWLNHSNDYMFGDKITIADLLAAADLEQLRIVGYDPMKINTRFNEYIELIKKTMNPYYDEANTIIDLLAMDKHPKKEAERKTC